MSKGTADFIGATGHRINIIKAKEQVHIDTFIVLPFDAQHDVPEPLGFVIYSTVTKEKLLFITDSYYCKYKFPGLTHIMVEANYSPDILQRNIDEGRISEAMKSRLLESHFSLPNVKKFFQANDLSKVEEIYLLHLSAGNSDSRRFKREIQELTGKVVIV
jgi:phosphoribosyl 1,2-cyclic phosphodiesterase